MSRLPPSIQGSREARRGAVVTGAAIPASAELRRRQLRYGITMAIRVGCFLAMIVVPGPLRWVLLGAAVVLPYLAMIAANQVDQRSPAGAAESPWPGSAADSSVRSIPSAPEAVADDVAGSGEHHAGSVADSGPVDSRHQEEQ